MRLKLPLLTLGLVLYAFAPAMAQNQASTTPYYNTTTQTPTYYNQTTNGTVPFYNNGNTTPALPIQQMVAGKDAPSYNYNSNNGVQPYNFGATSSSYSPQPTMTQEQQAAAYQQTLQAQLAAQQAAQQQLQQQQYGQANLQALTQYPNSPFGTAPQAPKQRKVVYKELNNPLKDPPRLFNPDQ